MKDNKMTAYTGALAYTKPAYPHAHLPLLTAADVPDTTLMRTLYRALGSRRANGSMSEARFVAWLCNRLPVTMIDAQGNVHVDLRTKPSHRTMFSAHTDTVHYSGGTNTIRLDKTDPKRTLWRADKGECLGADDGAGVALMVHMIDAGVPALYVFFRGEESGGIGSSWMGKDFKGCLKDIDRCVSFDRADQSDVITHQGGSRCCSDAFAHALADALTTYDLTLAFVPDSTGVFTDSANLTHVIPECTNLSVGYKHQHGDNEYQDVTFLAALADQLVKVQWDALPTERDPSVYESKYARTAEPYVDLWNSPMGNFLSGTDVPADAYVMDAYEEHLATCLSDAAFGKSEPLRVAVADWANCSVKHIDVRSIKPHEYETLADGLYMGTYDADDVYDYLYAALFTKGEN